MDTIYRVRTMGETYCALCPTGGYHLYSMKNGTILCPNSS